MLALVALAFAWLSAPQGAFGQDGAADGVMVEYAPPTGPGDDLSIRFPVPADHLAGVILMVRSPAATLDDEAFTGAFILPVLIDPANGDAVLAGVVPETVSAEQLVGASLEFRIALLNDLTGKVWLSESFPLLPEDPKNPFGTADDDVASDDGSPGDGTDSVDDYLPSQPGSTDDDVINDTQSGSTGSTNNSSGGFGGKTGVTKLLPLVTLGDVAVKLGIHDQPTPIQGSGH